MKMAAVSSILVTLMLLAVAVVVQAQHAAKSPRIGYLAAAPPSAIKYRTDAFRQGLRDLGYIEGNNIVVEWRSPEGKREPVPALVAELIRPMIGVRLL
jgi:putative ABC transport system substrate-binding protein